MTNTPYFILILLYAGFLGSVVVLNIAVHFLVSLLQLFWSWQRGRVQQQNVSVGEGLVAHAS